MHWKDCNKPTQTIYHIPKSVLRQTNNLIVLFEEGSPPNGIALDVKKVHIVMQASKFSTALNGAFSSLQETSAIL